MAVELLARPPIVIGGRFVVVDEIGEGGTAIVYLAYDRRDQTWVALKALLFRHMHDDLMRRRFNQEAATLGSFSHPNIPRLIAHEPLASPPHMAIELARRGSAMDWLREHGPMPAPQAVDVLDQVCEALRVAHAAGVVHRDVKPHNVLLFDGMVAKLTDFGIARVADSTSFTATGAQIGTFSFMAPEQRSNTKAVDARADVYSVGASLYALLTARTSAELFLADPTDDWLANVPTPLRDVILTATRYRPDDRYLDVERLQDAMRRALTQLSPSASRPVPPARAFTPLPRTPPPTLPAGRRFSDLERSLALDASLATFVEPEQPFARPDAAARPEPHTPMVVPRSRWLAYGSGAGALAVVALALVLLVGAVQVRAARTETDDAESRLVAAVRAAPDLGLALGDERLGYERSFDAFVSATVRDDAVEAALACVHAAEGHADEARIRRLVRYRDDVLRAQARGETIASTFPGSWAVMIGLARGS